MNKELIIVLTWHRKFGVVLIPCIISPSDGAVPYSVIDKASPVNVQDVVGYCEDYETIVKLYGTIDDVYIARLFSKEPPSDFLRHVDKEFIANRIRPHIEIRLKKMLKLAVAHKLRIFTKDPKYSQFYRDDEITVGGKSQVLFLFDRNENGIRYRIAIDHGDHYDKLKGKTAVVISDKNPCNVVINKVLYSFPDIDSKKFTPFLTNDFIHIRKETENAYFEKFIFNIVRDFRVRATGFNVYFEQGQPKLILNLDNDIEGNPVLLLRFSYGKNLIFPNNPSNAFVDMNRDGENVDFMKIKRNREAENEAVESIKQLGFTTPNGIHFYAGESLPSTSDAAFYSLINTINAVSEKLEAKGIIIHSEYAGRRYHLGLVNLTITSTLRNDWFDIHGTVTIGDFNIPFVALRHHLVSGIREYELPDGTIAVLPAEWFARYAVLFQVGQVVGHQLSVKSQMFGLLHETGIASDDVERLRQMFNVADMPKASLPQGLNANLRPYQLTGYYWMKLLKNNGFGGCLADDMGLGKTLQALTLLLDASTDVFEAEIPMAPKQGQLSFFDVPEVRKKRPTSLIVMPLSLIHNWCAEAERFTPSLKVLPYVGNVRARDTNVFDDYDVVVTTYGLVRNDCSLLSNYPFYYVILDESQAIKNSASKSYNAVASLKSKYRLVLTGTPIENSLNDLWSQINFINQGMLGSQRYFRTEYVSHIERDPECQRAAQLKSIVEPFILRRTKEQVASDLPPKTEQIRLCDMSGEQHDLYEREKSAARNELQRQMESGSTNRNPAFVLKALTRLRQIACHPQLIGAQEPSAKFDEVTRVLETILSEGHKVLIFSSFVEYLNIYEQYLLDNAIVYTKLTGDTKRRDEVVQKFQTDEQTRVFLISLKAGGVGLNLTAADYVFVLDPWWNPSVENQAIDRAHRIGQTKNVFVYKFVVAGTLEEKILDLQNRKNTLASVFASSNPLGALTVEEMMQLFE